MDAISFFTSMILLEYLTMILKMFVNSLNSEPLHLGVWDVWYLVLNYFEKKDFFFFFNSGATVQRCLLYTSVLLFRPLGCNWCDEINLCDLKCSLICTIRNQSHT